MSIVCWYEYVCICEIACVWLCDMGGRGHVWAGGGWRRVFCVLTCIGMWEEGAVRKPVAGEDGVLCVDMQWHMGRKGTCVSSWRANTGYCVLICIGIWEEGTMCKPVAGEDEKSWIIELKLWCVLHPVIRVWMKVHIVTKWAYIMIWELLYIYYTLMRNS